MRQSLRKMRAAIDLLVGTGGATGSTDIECLLSGVACRDAEELRNAAIGWKKGQSTPAMTCYRSTPAFCPFPSIAWSETGGAQASKTSWIEAT